MDTFSVWYFTLLVEISLFKHHHWQGIWLQQLSLHILSLYVIVSCLFLLQVYSDHIRMRHFTGTMTRRNIKIAYAVQLDWLYDMVITENRVLRLMYMHFKQQIRLLFWTVTVLFHNCLLQCHWKLAVPGDSIILYLAFHRLFLHEFLVQLQDITKISLKPTTLYYCSIHALWEIAIWMRVIPYHIFLVIKSKIGTVTQEFTYEDAFKACQGKNVTITWRRASNTLPSRQMVGDTCTWSFVCFVLVILSILVIRRFTLFSTEANALFPWYLLSHKFILYPFYHNRVKNDHSQRQDKVEREANSRRDSMCVLYCDSFGTL